MLEITFHKELEQFLDKNLDSMLISKQIKVLDNIKHHFIDEYIKNKLKNVKYCEYCKEYFNKEQWDEIHRIETHNECTYIDSGYGDDDMFGDVTSEYIYQVCPFCKKEKFKNKYIMKIENEKKKWE